MKLISTAVLLAVSTGALAQQNDPELLVAPSASERLKR